MTDQALLDLKKIRNDLQDQIREIEKERANYNIHPAREQIAEEKIDSYDLPENLGKKNKLDEDLKNKKDILFLVNQAIDLLELEKNQKT